MADTVLDWMRLTIAGFRRLAENAPTEAAFAWLRAADVCASIPTKDPRFGTAKGNAGVANTLLDRDADAQIEFNAARESWNNTLQTIGSLSIAIENGSSSHHFRLASVSLDAFANAHRRKYKSRCESSIAIIEFNSRLRSLRDDRLRRSAQDLERLTSDVHGPNSPESRLLSAITTRNNVFDPASYRDKADRVEKKVALSPSRLSDPCFRIEIAADLLAISPIAYFSTVSSETDQSTPICATSGECK